MGAGRVGAGKVRGRVGEGIASGAGRVSRLLLSA